MGKSTVLPAAMIAGAVLLFASVRAEAALSVCNKTTHATAVALGFVDDAGWNSAGWWTIPPGACSQLIRQPLNARYYYLYAEHQEIGGAWRGDRSFCVKPQPGQFRIQGRQNCSAQGYEARRFFQVDTHEATNWTENLAD